MNSFSPGPEFSSALRGALLEQVGSRTSARRRRWWLGVTVLGIAMVTGTAGIATAQLLTPPGTPIVNALADPVSGSFTGTGTLDLGPVPAHATGISVTVTCHSDGTFSFGSFGTLSCAEGSTTDAWGTVPLGLDQQRTITLETTPDASWSITAHYVETIDTDWGINASGQTFGAPKDEGLQNPDLVPVTALNCSRGYARYDDLYAVNDITEMTWDEGIAFANGPNRLDRYIPVYESDGTTVVGEFLIPGTDSTPISLDCP
jgi:hypothetical protein